MLFSLLLVILMLTYAGARAVLPRRVVHICYAAARLHYADMPCRYDYCAIFSDYMLYFLC